MSNLLIDSVFFGVLLTLGAYQIGQILKQKFKLALFNPILITVALIIITLTTLDIPYTAYQEGAKYISYMLTPATICLAIPMYEQLEPLKRNKKAILAGIASGVISSLTCILALSILFRFDHATYVTLLPKSITTAIGMGVCEELGGYVTISVVTIITTGILGNMIGETVCRVFHIKEPISKGLALGTASHAIGTAKALEMGEVEGAMGGLSIAIAGLLTVVGASIFHFSGRRGNDERNQIKT